MLPTIEVTINAGQISPMEPMPAFQGRGLLILLTSKSTLPKMTLLPTVEATTAWLKKEVWNLPVLDTRSVDDILGYGDNGLCN